MKTFLMPKKTLATKTARLRLKHQNIDYICSIITKTQYTLWASNISSISFFKKNVALPIMQ